MVMVMSTFRPPSSLTLACAKEGKDIGCTRGKLSERARMERKRWMTKGEGRRGRVEEKARRGRRIWNARHFCGLENLPLHLPRQGYLLLCQDQESSEMLFPDMSVFHHFCRLLILFG